MEWVDIVDSRATMDSALVCKDAGPIHPTFIAGGRWLYG